ncbi:hypothetical protein QYM36_005451 [Artemia franciscana]|uniref:Mannosyltransferase n=1 Tax=Artemia franciscana TaxID=6661 RepID=A0AA88HYD0_ARTSF|nr:hypothetical protein QYM36_005451 [Artemia franciscana]
MWSLILVRLSTIFLVQTWIIVSQWNFLKFNVIEDGASHFGRHHSLWYLIEGLPPLFGPMIVMSMMSFKTSRKTMDLDFGYERLVFGATIIFALLIYSVQPHKEHRFLLPIVPFISFLAAIACFKLRKKKQNRIIALTLCFNIPLGLYFCFIHQRAPLDVVKYLAEEAKLTGSISALFLLPCHSTPMFSHIHYPIEVKYFTCLPNLNYNRNYVNEADGMLLDPVGAIKKNLFRKPTYVIAGTYLQNKIAQVLKNYGYIRKHRYLHHLISVDRVGNFIDVYKLNNI